MSEAKSGRGAVKTWLGRHPVLGFALAAGAVGMLLYGGTLAHPFHYDDRHSILYNPHLRSLGKIPAYFTDLHTFSSDSRGAMFRPLVLVSYALNYAAGGQDPRGYRLVNLLLHLGCAVLLFAWLRRALDWRAAWVGGLVFLAHPTHGEPVNYLSSRSDLMVSCWYLGGVLLAARGNWAGSCAAYAGGLLSKEVAITLPLLVGAQQGWSRVRLAWRPYLALGLIGLGYLALISLNRFLPGSLAKAPRGWGEQALTQVKAHGYYLWLFIMPARLSVEHQFFVSSGLDAPVVFAALLLGSLCWLAWQGRGHLPALGWAWFLLALAPASLVPLNILVSERRMYLASAGLCLALAWLWQRLPRRRLGWAAPLLVVLLAALSERRNPVWASEASLWEDAVAKGPQMYRARANLALAYKHQGREEEALRQMRQALDLRPDYADAWGELGNLLADRGEPEGAAEAYTQALRHNPQFEGAYYNLGNLVQGRGEYARAAELYQEALRHNPGFAEARNNLGQAYEALGRGEEALAEYRRALELNPELAQAWYNLAAALEGRGEAQEAAAAYRRCRQLLLADPAYRENAQYREFAGRALERAQRLEGN
jgi:tetratricopeptide (TPR) repeat protein